ncbi:CHAT domain-containing protein [Aspergillus varians]
MDGSANNNSPLAAHLGREGRALLLEYHETGDRDYLEGSISIARQALENALPHERAIYLNDLGYRLRERFEACRNIDDISEAIQLVEQSSRTISNRSLQAIVLNNLATFLSDRFEWSQDTDDLERGITAANHALELSSSNVGFQAECKNTLCLIYGYRYTKFGNVEDLETATRMAQQAVDMTAQDDENLAMFMANLGICHERRFERLGNPTDIEKAVDYARITVDSTDPDNSTERSLYLKNLSNSLGRRFAITDNLQDIENAIDHGIEAANLIPDHPRWPELLHNVSLLLEDRFMRLGDMADLDEGINLEDMAVSAITGAAADDPRLLTHWDHLGVLYGTKFDFGNEMSDLDMSIELAQRTLDTSIDDSGPDVVRSKWHMAWALNRRFERLGEVADLDRAILLGTEALNGVAQNDPRRIDLLLDISDFQYAKSLKSGLMEHFELAITLTQEAMNTEVPNGFDRPLQLCTISRRLGERYTFTRSEDDIQRSIELAQKAVSLVPAERPQSPYCLWHISLALGTRYRVQGSLSDLERSIQVCQNALAAVSLGRLDRFEILYSLSVQLTHRYEQLGALVDLEEAIHLMRETKENIPNSHFGRMACLKTLSDQLGYLFERNKDMSTLTEAVGVANDALELYTDEDITKVSILNSLGLLLRSRFSVTGSLDDLKAAIDVQREALRIIPEQDPERSLVLYNVGVSLADLFRQSREPQYLIEATGIGWEAVSAATESHPNRAMYLNAVGVLFQEYSDHTGSIFAEGRTSADLFTEALRHQNSPPLDRIKAGQNAFHSCVVHEEWNGANVIARDVVKLFPLLVPRWMSRADQQHLLKNISNFTSLAASAALQENGSPKSALEILEAGRGVIAGLTIDLKTDISILQELEPALYREYTQLRRRILLPIASSLSQGTENSQPILTLRGRRKSRSHLPPRITTACPERAEDLKTLEDLEDRIRAVPGFERFLERQSEEDYILLAKSGPIVAFNVTEHRSDAIIITSTSITSIPLKKLHFQDLKVHVPKVIGKNQLSKGGPSTKRKRNQELQNILHWLWDTAVLPILTELQLLVHHDHSDTPLPRIWWVASGYMGLFPMHAAGDGRGTATMDYVISSYIPTLQVLKFSQMRQGQRPRDSNLKMLIVPAPEKAGQQDLNTEEEIESITEGLKDTTSYIVLNRPSRVDVLQELPSSHLIHFSCHGESNPIDPSYSGLALSPTAAVNDTNSLLTVKDLAAINHEKAQLAYLSACSTAENSSDDLLDEVIHVASAFQLVGFPHVIGTLWEIGDRAAVGVSRLFYADLGRRIGAGCDLNKTSFEAIKSQQMPTAHCFSRNNSEIFTLYNQISSHHSYQPPSPLSKATHQNVHHDQHHEGDDQIRREFYDDMYHENDRLWEVYLRDFCILFRRVSTPLGLFGFSPAQALRLEV